jgi:hypothetical protein
LSNFFGPISSFKSRDIKCAGSKSPELPSTKVPIICSQTFLI